MKRELITGPLIGVLAVISAWILFFPLVGFLARAAKELFCVGYGC